MLFYFILIVSIIFIGGQAYLILNDWATYNFEEHKYSLLASGSVVVFFIVLFIKQAKSVYKNPTKKMASDREVKFSKVEAKKELRLYLENNVWDKSNPEEKELIIEAVHYFDREMKEHIAELRKELIDLKLDPEENKVDIELLKEDIEEAKSDWSQFLEEYIENNKPFKYD